MDKVFVPKAAAHGAMVQSSVLEIDAGGSVDIGAAICQYGAKVGMLLSPLLSPWLAQTISMMQLKPFKRGWKHGLAEWPWMFGWATLVASCMQVRPAALVVMRENKNSITRFFMGSVSRYCAVHSTVPVIIVPS